MIEEIDQKEFDDLKAEKRHKELIAALKGLTSVVKELEPLLHHDDKQDRELLFSLRKTNITLDELLIRVQELSLTAPKVNLVMGSAAEVLNKMSGELKSIGSHQQDKPSEYDFEVIRNAAGYIQSVKAKIKK